jgi:predicted DCC family thiol-disulfide oxidoreductase YuxK
MNDVTQIIDGRVLVLYDADCGICSRSARFLRRLDASQHLQLMPLQDAGDIVDAPSAAALRHSVHVRDRDGRWSCGGAAWIKIAAEIPLFRPLAIAARLAPVRSVVEWAYWRIADNRHRLSHLLGDDACRIEPRTRSDFDAPA